MGIAGHVGRQTPVCAGRPAWPSRPPASWPANPRLRGAATNTNHSFHHSLGKPPSAQSGLHLHRAQGRLPRQTPVCAGRPLFRAAGVAPIWQTPVCAGRPRRQLFNDTLERANPRLRGAAVVVSAYRIRDGGKPPSARGGPFRVDIPYSPQVPPLPGAAACAAVAVHPCPCLRGRCGMRESVPVVQRLLPRPRLTGVCILF